MLVETSSQTLKSQEELTLRTQMSSVAKSLVDSSGEHVAEAVRRVCERQRHRAG